MLKFKQFLAEAELKNHIDEFVKYAQQELEIAEPPKVIVVDSKEEAAKNKSFGAYAPGLKTIYVNVAGRHIADILRTLGHEMVHHKQNEDGLLQSVEMAGETGSTFENEANNRAGVLMRNYGRANPIYEEIEK